jgi:hypothetical protein
MGSQAAEKVEIMCPQPVGDAMEPDRMQTGVTEDDLQHATRRRIPVKDGFDIFPYRSEHFCYLAKSS